VVLNRGSISSKFYKQLLHTQIPKAQKRHSSCQSIVLLGSAHLKAALKTLMKLTLGCHGTQGRREKVSDVPQFVHFIDLKIYFST